MTTTVTAPVSSTPAYARLRSLVVAYVVLCALTVVAEAVAAAVLDAAIGSPAWTRSVILVVVALVAALLTRHTGRGSARAFLRLRIVTAVQAVATAVIVVLPGAFPGWLRIEQAVCLLVLVGVVGTVNGRALRDAVGARAATR